MKISEIKSVIKELIDEIWLSDFRPQTQFDIQMGTKEKTAQSWWIKPDGTLFRTTYRGHYNKAIQILQAYPDKEKEIFKKDPQLILWDMGWVSFQIIIPDGRATIKHSAIIPPTPEQIKALRNLATEFNDDPNHHIKIDYIKDETFKKDIILESIINERLTFADIYDDTDDERIFKSKLPGMKVRPLIVSTNNDRDMWRFEYGMTSNEKSEWERYREKVGHKGHIYFFKENIDPEDNLEDLECMVDCDCRDFKYRFAYVLAQQDAGFIGAGSLNKAISSPPIKTNPRREIKLCKHLAAVRKYLITNIEKAMQRAPFRKRPFTLTEAMDELTNKGKFITAYYDEN